jgi:hypothetical protein
MTACVRLFVLLGGLLVLVAAIRSSGPDGTGPAATGQVRETVGRQTQQKMTEAVRKALPEGWAVTRTRAGTMPSGWHSEQPRAGFTVEARNGRDSCSFCFVPADWVGIRRRPEQPGHPWSWEWVLSDGLRFKTIITSTDERLRYHSWWQLTVGGPCSPSLGRHDYDKAVALYGGVTAADRAAWRLIERHCRDADDFAIAARSLLHLGVPARTVFLRAAREVDGMDRDCFTGVLGDMGGPDAIGVLCDLVADPRLEDIRRGYVASALRGHTDEQIGPALQKAVREIHEGEGLERVCRTLVPLRYRPAAPDLLIALERARWPCVQAAVADVLAALRYREAVPALVKVRDALARRPADRFGLKERFDSALLRINSEWGRPGIDCRSYLLPPRRLVVGQPMVFTLITENIGTEPAWSGFKLARHDFVIDGQREPRPRSFIVIATQIQYWPGQVEEDTIDLSPYLTEPGEHTVQYDRPDPQCRVRVRVEPAGR